MELVKKLKEAEIDKRIVKYLPSIERPTFRLPLKKKIVWVLVVLGIYYLLTHVRIIGIERSPAVIQELRFFELILGARIGSIVTLGIGPIVTAGILLQLLVGSKIINWNLTEREDREKFERWNKILAVSFCFIEGFAYAMSGFLPLRGGFLTFVFVSLQLALGGIIVLLLDDLISKHGIGSGVSLFIVAGVSVQIFSGLFSPFDLGPPTINNPGPKVGLVLNFFHHLLRDNLNLALLALIPIFSTILIFLLVAWIQDVSVKIPLTFTMLRGFSRSWSLKLLYTSNIPIILAAALLSNLQLMARFGTSPQAGLECNIWGCFDRNGNPVSGIIYYITAPPGFIFDVLKGTLTSSEIIRALTYTLFLTALATLFSVLWVYTAGMDPESVAKQLSSMEFQIPGFRRDENVMKSVLERYIPPLSLIGGILVGLIAAFADLIGAIGSGMGILLTVMIIFQFYERLKMERFEDEFPAVKKILG